ncbi:MAG: hypothetical protein EAZ07_03420 [Cytophagales bacterium]|nr:MAG: hypothetical protein EAZ07_03420 [Cytophagales bacterium]
MNCAEKILNDYPKCWAELNEFYSNKYSNLGIGDIEKVLELPFAFLMGFYVEFFTENGIEVDVQSLNLELIEQSVWESFQILENTIGHFS